MRKLTSKQKTVQVLEQTRLAAVRGGSDDPTTVSLTFKNVGIFN
jgi:hypothetical protein